MFLYHCGVYKANRYNGHSQGLKKDGGENTGELISTAPQDTQNDGS